MTKITSVNLFFSVRNINVKHNLFVSNKRTERPGSNVFYLK